MLLTAFVIFALGILPLITLTVVISLILYNYAGQSERPRPAHTSVPRRK